MRRWKIGSETIRIRKRAHFHRRIARRMLEATRIGIVCCQNYACIATQFSEWKYSDSSCFWNAQEFAIWESGARADSLLQHHCCKKAIPCLCVTIFVLEMQMCTVMPWFFAIFTAKSFTKSYAVQLVSFITVQIMRLQSQEWSMARQRTWCRRHFDMQTERERPLIKVC